MMHFGMSNTLTTCYKNRSAALGVVMLSCTGVSTARLVALSTTIIMPLNACDIGRPNMKSIVYSINRAAGGSSGYKGPGGRYVLSITL